MNEIIISSASVKSGDVLLCIGCLATDCRMYDIRENPLRQSLEDLTGSAVLGRVLCYLCLQQLHKCQLFRRRCLNTNTILKLIQETKVDSLFNVDRTNLKVNLQTTQATIVNISPHAISTKKEKVIDKTQTLFVNVENPNQIELTEDDNTDNDSNSENARTVIENDYLATTPSTTDDDISNDDLTSPAEDSDELEENKPKRKRINKETKTKVRRKKTKIKTEMVSNDEEPEIKVDTSNTNELTMVLNPDDSNISDVKIPKEEPEETNELDATLIPIHHVNEVKPKPLEKRIDEADEMRKSKLLYRVFVNIWREVSKNKGDIHELFLRIYKISFIKYRPKMPKNVLRKKGLSESVKIMKFVDLHKELADFYNVDIKFINIEDQKRDMNEKRESVADKEEYCQLCCKKYVKDGTLERHMKQKHEETHQYKCKVCLYTFDKQCHLAAHILKSHAMEVRCRDCSALLIVSISSNWMIEANTHKALHLGNLATCEFCGKTFTARKLYYMHIRAMHRANIDAVTCLFCGDSYNGPAGLRSHVHRMHAEVRQCPACSVLFMNEETLSAHTARNEDCQSLSACGRCGANFPSERLMKEHYDDAHAKCKCDVCKHPYYGKQRHKDHLKECKGNPFMGRKRGVRKRQGACEGDDKMKRSCCRATADDREYVCEVCGQGFKSAGRIAAHQKKHALGDKPYICDLCGKAFRLKLTLKTHMFVHTGERPYKCAFCPKTFRQHAHLKAHMPTHTQEKAHECHICKKRFTNKSNRRTHVKTVHEGLPARKKKRPLPL